MTEGAPLVTVLMPVKSYHPRFLNEAIESILNQSSPNWLMNIIVEKSDASKFKNLLERFLNDQRIELVVNQGRKLAGAFNTGMFATNSEFAAILLADDLWAPNAVETLNGAIRHYVEADFFHSSRRYIDEAGSFISSVYPCREGVQLNDFRQGTPVKHLLCWRVSLARKCGGLDETLNSVGPDDFDFPWTMAEHGARFQSIKECLYLYREHDCCFRLTTGLPRSVHEKEIRRVLEKHGIAENAIKAWLEHGQKSYLHQCKYRSNWQRWWYRLIKKGGRFSRPVYR